MSRFTEKLKKLLTEMEDVHEHNQIVKVKKWIREYKEDIYDLGE